MNNDQQPFNLFRRRSSSQENDPYRKPVDRAVVKIPSPSANVIIMMFKAAGGPGLDGIEQVWMRQATAAAISISRRAIMLGIKSLNKPVEELSEDYFGMSVKNWFGADANSAEELHDLVTRVLNGLLKVHKAMTSETKVLTFIDVRCSGTSRRYDENNSSSYSTRKPPDYVVKSEPSDPPTYDELLKAETFRFPALNSDTLLIDQIAGADVSETDFSEVHSDNEIFERGLISGLHVNITDEIFENGSTMERKTRIIYNHIIEQVLFLGIITPIGCLNRNQENRPLPPHDGLPNYNWADCWTYFLDCFRSNDSDFDLSQFTHEIQNENVGMGEELAADTEDNSDASRFDNNDPDPRLCEPRFRITADMSINIDKHP